MSLQDVFGSDLEDSDGEDYKASSEQAEINDLFGESGSEEEDDKPQRTRKLDSESEEEEDKDDTTMSRDDEDVDEKVC